MHAMVLRAAPPNATECPRLRGDLVITRRDTVDGRGFLVRDPVADRFVRLGEVEYFIASLLDGAIPLGEVRRRVEERFAAPLPLEVLEHFVEKLRRLGLLAGERVGPPARPGRVCGSMLHLRVRVIDPDRLLGRLLRVLGFCFSPGFMIVSGLTILLAGWVAAENAAPLARDLTQLVDPEMIALGLLMAGGVTILHEFAHGLTCKRFGGDVREIGFLLLYGLPCFYCNVNSAWQFPEKSRRLWVTAAGAYCELLCWAVALLCWRITQPGTAIHLLALLVVATTGLRTLFNLNPLIKLDGYYLLSDYLEVPNLRERAFRYLAARAKRLVGWSCGDLQQSSPRLQRIYLTYGLLAVVFSVALPVFVAWNVGGFLMSSFQGAGFLVFAGLVVLLLHRPLLHVLALPWTARKGGKAGIGIWMRRGVKGLTIGATIYSALFLCTWELTVTGEFEVLPSDRAEVRAQVDGFLQEVCVGEGDRVSAGQVLARLSNPTLRGELAGAEAEARRQRAELAKLEAGPTHATIMLARREVETAEVRFVEAGKQLAEAERMQSVRVERATAAVEKAEARLLFAERSRERCVRAQKTGVGSAEELDRADECVATCRKECEQAKADLRLLREDGLAELRGARALAERQSAEVKARLGVLLAGTRAEDVTAARAELARLEARRQFLAGEVKRLTVVSPISGTVVTRRLPERLGAQFRPGDLVVEVQSLERVRVEIAVPEKEMDVMTDDCPVRFKVRACPGETFPAKIESIAPTVARLTGEDTTASPAVLIVAGVENDAGMLKPGMSGKAKVSCGERTIGALAARRVSRLIRIEFWSWW